ncbi:MAG TPA: ABC-F family ATP-binding cassette domain-containing protein, partial [Phycisphaerae bacterium]|nr:ABC-F family ATP-binding cassette domain-containing protein [Phycisphaerae bacterium]
YLLDRVVDKIADLDQRRVTVYPCAYSDYAESKRVRSLTAEREFEKQQEWLKHQREYAERVKADKSRAKQARGRLKALDRMERQGRILDRPVASRRKLAIQFTPSRRAGDMVLRCEGVSKSYGEVVLFDRMDLEICCGEKIGIVGPNGAGKTTLIRMAMGQVEPDAGQIRLYENLTVGYYDQEHAGLDREHRVIDAIVPGVHGPEEHRVRSFLARFLFTGDDVYKRVGDLSGGEQSRVVLARLMWANPQVLILDEPTNHLDIPAKEALEDAFIAYEGAILLVSHDRYFLDRVVNRLLVLPERGRYELMPGNWSTYEQRLVEEEARRRAEAEAARGMARQAARPGRKRQTGATGEVDDSPYANWSVGRIEEAIIEREELLEKIEHQFADPGVYRDAARARSLRAEADRLRTELADLNNAWESCAD